MQRSRPLLRETLIRTELPLNYWLGSLDILFLFNCKLCLINLKGNDRFEFCSGRCRRGASGLFLKSKKAKSLLYRHSFFVRICNIWNALPDNRKGTTVFRKKLQSFVHLRLGKVIRSFKLVCVKCRRFNALNYCAY